MHISQQHTGLIMYNLYSIAWVSIFKILAFDLSPGSGSGSGSGSRRNNKVVKFAKNPFFKPIFGIKHRKTH